MLALGKYIDSEIKFERELMMKKKTLFLISLLVIAGLVISACGDIGPAPSEFPALAYACPSIHTSSMPETQAYSAETTKEWNKLRWSIGLNPWKTAGLCE